MSGEFKKRIKMLGLDNEAEKKVLEMIREAGSENGCLACPSKDTCDN